MEFKQQHYRLQEELDPRLQMMSGGLSGSASPFLGSVFLRVSFCFREAPFQEAFPGSSKLVLCPAASHRSEGTSSLDTSQVPGLRITGVARGQLANQLREAGMSPHHCGRKRRDLWSARLVHVTPRWSGSVPREGTGLILEEAEQ